MTIKSDLPHEDRKLGLLAAIAILAGAIVFGIWVLMKFPPGNQLIPEHKFVADCVQLGSCENDPRDGAGGNAYVGGGGMAVGGHGGAGGAPGQAGQPGESVVISGVGSKEKVIVTECTQDLSVCGVQSFEENGVWRKLKGEQFATVSVMISGPGVALQYTKFHEEDIPAIVQVTFGKTSIDFGDVLHAFRAREHEDVPVQRSVVITDF